MGCRDAEVSQHDDNSDGLSDTSSDSGSETDPATVPGDVQDFLDECFPACYVNLFDLQGEKEWCPEVCPHMVDPNNACDGCCDIKFNGYIARRRSYDVDGPHTLHVRDYKCTSHNCKFNVWQLL